MWNALNLEWIQCNVLLFSIFLWQKAKETIFQHIPQFFVYGQKEANQLPIHFKGGGHRCSWISATPEELPLPAFDSPVCTNLEEPHVIALRSTFVCCKFDEAMDEKPSFGIHFSQRTGNSDIPSSRPAYSRLRTKVYFNPSIFVESLTS